MNRKILLPFLPSLLLQGCNEADVPECVEKEINIYREANKVDKAIAVSE